MCEVAVTTKFEIEIDECRKRNDFWEATGENVISSVMADWSIFLSVKKIILLRCYGVTVVFLNDMCFDRMKGKVINREI